MKVAVLSYPMLFQNQGGLQVQILETINALNELSIDAQMINPNQDKLSDFDIIHVFSAINGNHRIVEQAKAIGKLVVTSPLISNHWNYILGKRANFFERVVGRFTNWDVKTEYAHILSCLAKSDRLIALGPQEKDSIVDAFGILKEKVQIIPNGIPERFFSTNSELFVEKTSIKSKFVLYVASISKHKNQITLAEATKGLGVPLVLIGPCLPGDNNYLESLLSYNHVRYLGSLAYDDPLLASAYSAASVFCIPSISEVMPLCVLESLASGTPVVMTKHHSMDARKFKEFLKEIAPRDVNAIQQSLLNYLEHEHDSQLCRSTVSELTWHNVGQKIANIYSEL